MTVPARPKAFLDPFEDALYWFAVHVSPGVTKKWSEFCDELILQEDVQRIDSGLAPRWSEGDLMIPANVLMGRINKDKSRSYEVDMLRHYSKQKLRRLSGSRNKKLTLEKRCGSDYNPFNTLLQSNPMINNFLLSTTATTPEPIIPTLPPLPRLSSSSSSSTDMPKPRSPTRPSSGAGTMDMSGMAEALAREGVVLRKVSAEEVDNVFNAYTQDSFVFDGMPCQVLSGYHPTLDSSVKMWATRVKLMLNANEINDWTKTVSTCAMYLYILHI